MVRNPGSFSGKEALILTLLFFGLFAFSLALSFVATREVRDMANRRGWVFVPKDGRHVHRTPLPRLGGVAIFLAFLPDIIRSKSSAAW